MVEQALRRLWIGAQRRSAATEDAGLLEADGFAVRPQPVGMIERHRGDDGNIRFIGVDRIKTTAEADFEHCRLDTGGSKDLPGSQRTELEIGQHDTGRQSRRLDPGESRTEGRIVDRHAVQTDALVVGEDMRRGVAADLVAGAINDVFQVSAGRALAIGATNDDHRAVLNLAKRRLDLADALQTQLDAGLSPRMQAFEMGQPISKSFQAAAGWLSSSASVRAT